MIHLSGGPSHLNMYDMKPAAPAEYRGEFRPISTNVPGMEICELMPLQAKIADKFAILGGAQIANLYTVGTRITRTSRRSADSFPFWTKRIVGCAMT